MYTINRPAYILDLNFKISAQKINICSASGRQGKIKTRNNSTALFSFTFQANSTALFNLTFNDAVDLQIL